MKILIRSSLVAIITTAAVLAGDPEGGPKPFVQLKCSLVPIPVTAVHHNSKGNPRVRNANGTSVNWGGYAVQTSLAAPAANAVSSVAGTWTVPAIGASSTTTYCSTWVGIDGYSNGTVEQIGTEQDWVAGKGKKPGGQKNYAWFEMYPDWPYQIVNFPVEVGDQIGASVSSQDGVLFNLAITNFTKGFFYAVDMPLPPQSSAERSSAEWIVEAPWLGGTLPLADFGTVAFTGCAATLNGHSGPIADNEWKSDAITMQTTQKLRGKPTTTVIKAQPSAAIGDGFTMTWYHE